jgi:hypothetical protein
MLDLFKKHEHEHGMEKLMNEKLVHGSVYHDTTEMEMFVNLTDEVVVDHEEEELLITVQTEINHEIDTMEHVMLQVEDEVMMKK